MRTTINIDDDLLAAARTRAALCHRSLSAFVSDALREALARRQRPEPRAAVELPTVEGRLQPGVNYDSLAAMMELTEAAGE